jgi:O-antigen ligase
MVALIIWWVYFRNPLPAAMIAVGLICSVTRAAWVGTAVAIPLLAVIMQEKKRLVLYATVALALFAAAVPVLDLSDYLLANKTGKDSTVDYHRDAILDGLKYAADHPFGSGNTKLSAEGVKQDTNLTIFETTYPYFAAEYGIAASLCFVGFLFSALYLLWRTRSQLGYAAAGILVGMSLVMAVTLPLRDRRLSTWALLPIGMAVQSAMRRATPRVAATPEPLKGETA